MSHSYYECMVSNDVWLLIILAEGKSLSDVRCQYDVTNARAFIRQDSSRVLSDEQKKHLDEHSYIVCIYRRE